MIHQLFYLIYSSSCILDQESCLIYSMQKSKVSLKISSQLQNLITAKSYKKIIYQIYHDPLHSFWARTSIDEFDYNNLYAPLLQKNNDILHISLTSNSTEISFQYSSIVQWGYLWFFLLHFLYDRKRVQEKEIMKVC